MDPLANLMEIIEKLKRLALLFTGFGIIMASCLLIHFH